MAEQLVNEFTVNRPIDEAWAVITDVERIATCMPGAQLRGDRGGRLSRHRQGQARLDHPAVQGPGDVHRPRRPRAPRRAQGGGPGHRRPRQRRRRDHRPGREPVAHEHPVHRDDRPAHHRPGRPVRTRHPRRRVEEADGPVRQQPQHDARRPGRRDAVGGNGDAATPTTAEAEPHAAGAGTGSAGITDLPPAGAEQSGPQPRVRKIDGPATEPVDLAGVAGPAVLKRLAPLIAALIIVLFLLRRRR